MTVACGAALAASAAPAIAAGDVTSFTVTPASLTAGGDPSASTSIDFNYGSSTSDSVKDVTVTLPSGLLASPAAVASTCSPSQLASATSGGSGCPAGSQIGSGTISTSSINGTDALYLMPAPTSADVAGVGLVISVSDQPALTATGTVDVGTANSLPVLELKFTDLPDSFDSIPLQVTNLTLTINGTAPTSSGASSSTPFIRLPTSCSAATSSLTIDTQSGNDDGSATSSFTPTGCASLDYTPTLSATATKDADDSGVALTTTISQPATGQAGTDSATLAIPSSVLAPNLSAAVSLLNSGAAVGTATVTTPLLPAALKGTVTLTGTAQSPDMTLTFPAPFAFAMSGAISLANNSVSFTNVPDIPFTSMVVALSGGSDAVFTTNCGSTSGTLGGSFTGWNAPATSVAASAPLTVAGCPSQSTGPSGPSGPGSGSGQPAVSGGNLSGLTSGKPAFSFTLRAGKSASKIGSFTVSLPSGLRFVASKTLAKGISVSGAKVKSAHLSGGKLVVALKTPVAELTVKLSSKVLKVSASLEKQIRKHKVKSLVATITAAGTSLRLTLTKLS
jgi:hypothetical protein